LKLSKISCEIYIFNYGCEDLWLFFEAKRGPRAKRLGNIETTCVQRYIMSYSRNHCCHVTATIRSLLIVAAADAAVNNKKVALLPGKYTCCRATKYILLLLTTASVMRGGFANGCLNSSEAILLSLG